MKEQIIAKSYAKAAIQIGNENKVDFAKELTKFQEVINSSNDLENVLFLDVFSVDEKLDVIKKITKAINLPNVVENFIFYIIDVKRISLLPMIYKEIIVLDDHEKGFLRGNIEGSDATIDENSLKQIKSFLLKKLEKETNLTYKQNPSLTAGFRVTIEDFQLDATIDNQLNNLKQSIIGE